MLRFSDDDVPLQDAQTTNKKSESSSGGSAKPTAVKKEQPVEGGEIGPNKPNFVYIVSISIIQTKVKFHLSKLLTHLFFRRILLTKIPWSSNTFCVFGWERDR